MIRASCWGLVRRLNSIGSKSSGPCQAAKSSALRISRSTNTSSLPRARARRLRRSDFQALFEILFFDIYRTLNLSELHEYLPFQFFLPGFPIGLASLAIKGSSTDGSK